MLPFVSIIIPCRNEEKFIGKCLDSIIAQDYPKDRLEVLVVDGMSEDGTREIVERYTDMSLRARSLACHCEQSEAISARDKLRNLGIATSLPALAMTLKLLDNPKKVTPCALNIGIKNAKGEIILWMSAHSRYEKDYISKCVKYLKEYDADNVGGVMITLPRDNAFIGKAIATVLSHPFGVGNSVFRTGAKEPKWVDTVFGGCYKKEVFDKIGLFNESLVRSQDMEFNLRLKKTGGKILLAPDIVSYYYPKSNLKDFFIHNFEDGSWVTYPLKFGIKAFSWRHLIPLFFILGLVGTGILGIFFSPLLWLFLFVLSSYLLVNLYHSEPLPKLNLNF
ncbi:MAG: glycosyl transferase [bacterium (Candidatus Ratteibacteria) CG_4_9_14_3_um_filter_41_21]|uniref:Glycosyl transferase n=1 Tax=bacterium (Candidatus Ratteibacteria) CG_4_9_14_3_um_filter_41_21 TaxID=2014289 RepID=A0A2M7YGP5_9BACT|nr:MAG: glycosyl transferase [bacterium (Candidatus Ratteibacteria) CG_4_9_14_3_um_filter_41_21]